MRVQKFKKTALTVMPLALFCGACYAEALPATDSDSFNDWLAQGNISGELKTMTFFKEFTGTLPNKRTSSLGGDIQYRSPELEGFSVGLGAYGAYNLGLNPSDVEKTEIYLPSDNTTVLGKAFLRYRGYGLDLQAGRFGLDTLLPMKARAGPWFLPFIRDLAEPMPSMKEVILNSTLTASIVLNH